MNKKGFTITELLAVIVILGILASLTSIGVTRYRHNVREKELINLHSTIETGFDDYRSRLILRGDLPPEDLNLCDNGALSFDITYNGNRLKCDSGERNVKIKTATISTKVKGDLLADDDYKTGKTEEDFKRDGTCMIISGEPVEVDGKTEIPKSCDKLNESYIPSKEEIICIKLETEEEELINDYKDENSLCRYWSE